MATMEKIVLLDNEIEAQLLAYELRSRDIPHLMVSYYDSAYDGLFQFSQGWGHVEASVELKDEILAILQDLRQGGADLEEEPS